jgi:hypothetical protein
MSWQHESERTLGRATLSPGEREKATGKPAKALLYGQSAEGLVWYDVSLARDHLCPRADHDSDAWLDIGVACFADGRDAAVLDPDVSFQNSAVIDDYRIRDYGIDGLFGGALGLTHPVPDHFTAAKFHLLSVNRKIVLNLDKQLRVGQSHQITSGGAKHFRVGVARNFPSNRLGEHSVSELAHHQGIKSIDDFIAREFHEFDGAFLSRFKSYGGTGGDV